MFQTAYDSVWHQPGTTWLAVLVLLVLALPRPVLRGYFILFAIEIAIDAFFSGPFVPKRIQNIPHMMTALSVVFVILGDYRYFVLVENASTIETDPSAFGRWRGWARALPYAFIVPVASEIVRAVAPAPFVDERKTYLLYEVMFLVVALVMRFVVLPRRLGLGSPSNVKNWLYVLTGFEIVQYGLWALADVIILAGHSEPGYLLRLFPNVLYYGVFLLFVWRAAPANDRGREPAADARDRAAV